ncbi:MAG: phytoene/squalene synthase family protein [Oligoflexus sp.]
MAGKPEQGLISSQDLALLDQQCRESMKKGSLSFFLASRLLPKEQRLAIFRLYMWCRYCDDQIDRASLRGEWSSLNGILQDLREQTKRCYHSLDHQNPVFRAFALLVQQYNIPQEYPLELLAGMEMDIQNFHYRSFEDLLLYCYRVAGTVGLMACHIFGVRDESALLHADSMGRAMQLTNIARDIIDDASLNRVYIPDEWFVDKPLQAREILKLPNRAPLVPLAQRLVDEAENLYRQGEQGLIHLPWQCALAVGAARHIYAEIGHRVVECGAGAWDTRTWIPGARKLALLGRACLQSLTAAPQRLSRPWKAAEISVIRRPV